jgi:putative transposase
MEGLFESEAAKRRRLPPNIRRLIVDLKSEYQPFNLNEIANVVRACFGRKPDVRSVKRVLDEEALPLKLERNYPRYHQMDAYERRATIVELRVDGWSAKAIAGHLGAHRTTVYKALKRFKEEGIAGLADKSRGRPAGVRKVTLAAIEEVRKLAQNPQIGAFRVHAALKQKGFDLSRATCGRVLAQVREIYGHDKPKSGGGAKKPMPFASDRHHEFWSADVRYLDMLDEELLSEGMVYAVAILENYSRAVLASSLTRRQDLNAFLAVLYRAVQEYGPPEAFVTDSGSVFLANRAQAIYRALGIRKVEIEKGQPWQSYIETAGGVQRRMADHYFAKAEGWSDLLERHDRWMHDYHLQEHYAHQHRKEGRRSPSEVLSWVKTPRYREEDLGRAFFSARHTRTLDGLGYLTLQRFRLYAEEGLTGTEVAVGAGGQPDRGARRGGALPLRGRVRTGGWRALRGQAAKSEGPHALRDLHRAAPAQALRSWRGPRRSGVGEVPQAGRVRAAAPPASRRAPAGPIRLHGGNLATISVLAQPRTIRSATAVGVAATARLGLAAFGDRRARQPICSASAMMMPSGPRT